MRDYSKEELMDYAEINTREVRLASSGPIVGIALPDWVQAGMILGPDRARELAAQLLLECDLWDAIIDEYESRIGHGRETQYTQTYRRLGKCPRGTPGCKYADCSDARGKSCYGPNAPQHVDMGR